MKANNATTKTKKSFAQILNHEKVAGYVFILPFIIGFLVFLAYPMASSLVYSFFDFKVTGMADMQFVGLNNYIEMFTKDTLFWKVFWVTVKYAIFSVSLRLIMALAVAMLLVKSSKLSSLYRALYYLPSIIGSSVAVALLWKRIWASDGAINAILGFIGLNQKTSWLGQESTAIWILIILAVWQFGSSMLIFLSGLKQIPVSLYESATVDGATGPRKFFSITLPMLTPTIFFNLINQLISAFMAFTQAYIITQGKPNNSTYFYAYYMFRQSIEYGRMGYGCALAWFMVATVGILTLILFKSQKYWVYYEAEG